MSQIIKKTKIAVVAELLHPVDLEVCRGQDDGSKNVGVRCEVLEPKTGDGCNLCYSSLVGS